MVIPVLKLKHQLISVNAISKLIMVAVIVFAMPYLVTRFSIDQTDDNLIRKLDNTLALVDSLGIGSFVGYGEEGDGFGSYNILKEEYVSIERMDNDTLLNFISYSERVVDAEVVDFRVLSYSFGIDGSYYLIEIGESIEAIFTFQSKLHRYAIILMVVLLALTVVVEVLFISYLLAPLDKIIASIKSVNSPTSFNYAHVKTFTEDFIYLQFTIQFLMRRIEKAFNTEREYIGNVSHELLTPISVIRSKLENIINEGNLTEKDLERVYESKRTLARLTSMVRSLLMLSRLDNGEYPRVDVVNVKEIILSVTGELSDRLESKGLKVKIEWKTGRFFLEGNNELLFNMFYNLINNSIKFTDKGGITIEAIETGQLVAITITDTGKGMEADELRHIFTRFGKHDKEGEGFGLGLALVKKICDYHSITIGAESQKGVGTTFRLSLRLQ